MLFDTANDDNAMGRNSNAGDELELVRQWSNAMSDRGMYAANTARFKAQAIEALSSVLGPDEPRTAKYLLDNVVEITKRWIVKTNGKPETGRTYETRARTLLEDYVAYQADPRAFKGRHRPVGVRKESDSSKSDSSSSTPAGSAQPPVPPPAAVAAPGPLRSYPVREGGEFQYILPNGPFTVTDAFRFFLHLTTLAADFDPLNPAQAQMFALARRDSSAQS